MDDVSSEVADLLTFQYLANDNVVNVQNVVTSATTPSPDGDGGETGGASRSAMLNLFDVIEEEGEEDNRVEDITPPEAQRPPSPRASSPPRERPFVPDESPPHTPPPPPRDRHADDGSEVPYEPFQAEETRGADSEETELAKRTVLLDLARLEKQGVQLSRQWTMDDRYEDMLLEMRRHVMIMDENANVEMLKDGLKMFVTGVEVVSKRFSILDLDGWSAEVSGTLGKHDANLARIYRKYWRRGHSRNPELDIALSLVGSMGLFHLKSSMGKHLVYGGSRARSRTGGRRAQRREDAISSDEDAPP